MSEAEKATGIEDVLSSIRRLVAEHPSTTPEPTKVQMLEPEPKAVTETPSGNTDNKASSFVEKMNASIAEMTQDVAKTPAEKFVADQTEINPETQTNDPNTSLQTVTDDQLKTVKPVVVALEKPEPLVLRADMAATKQTAPAKTAQGSAEQEISATAFHQLPNEDTEEIILPTDIEDDEVALKKEMPPTAEQPASAQFIDEETIREIVSEMVRAELQGDLGDRITRNVRKLVRREIHHALAARELE